jgi:hypothetical protein
MVRCAILESRRSAVKPHLRADLTGDDAKPSCLISCSDRRSLGGDGRQGSIKPVGGVRRERNNKDRQ